MTSMFGEEGYIKLFIQLSLNDPSLINIAKSYQGILLNNKGTFNPLHVTILVIHIKRGTSYTDYLTSDVFFNDVTELYIKRHFSFPLESIEFSVQGKRPECFILNLNDKDRSFSMDIVLFNNSILELIQQKTSYNVLAFFSKEERMYVSHRDKDDKELFIVSNSHLSEAEYVKHYHMTIVTSFDIKKHNKELFKVYNKSDDGDKLNLLMSKIEKEKVECLSEIGLTESSILFSFKKDGQYVKYQ